MNQTNLILGVTGIVVVGLLALYAYQTNGHIKISSPFGLSLEAYKMT